MGELCLLVKLHREGSAPAACAAGLFTLDTVFKPANIHYDRQVKLFITTSVLKHITFKYITKPYKSVCRPTGSQVDFGHVLYPAYMDCMANGLLIR